MVDLLVYHFLDVLLGSLEPSSRPLQGLSRQHQASGDHSFSRRKDSIASTLLVFSSIGTKKVVLDITGKSDRV